MKSLACALAVLLVTSTLALAAAQKMTGTVVAVEKDIVSIKGADGKTYQIEAVKVAAENLKTGDIVEYEFVEGKVQTAKKKKAN
jgi:hypothetical protein